MKKRSINIYVKDYKELNKLRVELTNRSPDGKMVTFAGAIEHIITERVVLDR